MYVGKYKSSIIFNLLQKERLCSIRTYVGIYVSISTICPKTLIQFGWAFRYFKAQSFVLILGRMI